MFLLQLSNTGKAIYLGFLLLSVIAVMYLRSEGHPRAIQLGVGAAIYFVGFFSSRRFKK